MVSKSRRSVIKHRKNNKSTRKVQVRKPIRLKIKRKSTIKAKGKGKGKGKGKAKKSKKRSRSKKRKLRGGTPDKDGKPRDPETDTDEAGSSDDDNDGETTLVDDQSPVTPTGIRRRVPADMLRLPDPPAPDVQYSIEPGPDGQPLLPDDSPAVTSQLEERLRAAGLMGPGAQQEPWERMDRDLADFQRHLRERQRQERQQLTAELPLPPAGPPTQGQSVTAEQQAGISSQFNRLRDAIQRPPSVPGDGGPVFPLLPGQTGMGEGPLPSNDEIQPTDNLRGERLPTYSEARRMIQDQQDRDQGQGSESESE